MLNQTQEELINYLYTHGNTSSVQLAAYLKLSKRTVISYVKEINDSLVGGLIRSSNKGYYLDYEALTRFREAVPSLSVDDPAKRNQKIAKALLHGYRDKINIYDTAHALHYSESTIRATLYKIKEEVRGYGLDLVLRGSTAAINGSEHQKREYYYSLFQSALAQNLYDFTALYEMLPDYSDKRLYEQFLTCVRKYYKQIDDYEIVTLFYRLILATDRIAHAHFMERDFYTDFIRENDYNLAKDTAAEISRMTNAHYPDTEILYLAQMFSAISIFSGPASRITPQTLQNSLWPACYQLVQETADSIRHIYQRDIRENPEDFVYFALHIRSIIRRSRAAIRITNPYLSYVWDEYSSALDCAVYTAGRIQALYPEAAISKDDIACLALCLGNSFEQGFSDGVKPRVLFVLPSYYHVHQNLYQYYCDSFRHTVLAEHVTALSACDHLDSVDVVVSTQDLTGLNGKRFVKIRPIRTQSDLRQLQTLINELHHAKMIGNLQRLLKDMVPESRLTRCPAGVTDMESALDTLIRPLISRGIVSDDFKSAVLRREAFASTTWGQIALPRVPEYAAAEDAISILLFDTPVSWGDVSVRAIILFTSRDGHYNTHCLRILRRLIHVLRKKGGQNKFFSCQTYEDFCKLLT